MREEIAEDRFRLDCECGNCSLVAQYYPELINVPEDHVIYLHHEIADWYAERGLLQIIKDRIKLAWCILMGKKYILFEAGIRQNQLIDFRNYIDKIITNEKV